MKLAIVLGLALVFCHADNVLNSSSYDDHVAAGGLPLPVNLRHLFPLYQRINQLDGKIVGGTAANAGDAPWQIALLRSGSFTCGGSIINANTVVTAAHCVSGYRQYYFFHILLYYPFHILLYYLFVIKINYNQLHWKIYWVKMRETII